MSVSYDKEMKAKAKAENRCLYTIAISWPGGKPAMVVHGYATEDMNKEIHKCFEKLQAMGKKAFGKPK